jgi:hypothetical protein
MVNGSCGIVSQRFLTVWDECSWLVADSSQEFFSAGDYFILFLLHVGMIQIREVQKHTDPDQQHWFYRSVIGFEFSLFGVVSDNWESFSKAGMVSHSKAGFSHAVRMGYSSFDLCWQPLQGNIIWNSVPFSGTTASCKRDFKIMT